MTGQAHVLYRNKLTAAAHAVLAAGLRDRCPSKPSGLCRRLSGPRRFGASGSGRRHFAPD